MVDQIAVSQVQSITGMAESWTIMFGYVVRRGSNDGDSLSPGLVAVCGATDIALGIADDADPPMERNSYYDKGSVVGVLQSGSRVKAWLAAGESCTKGKYGRVSSSTDGQLAQEPNETRTVASIVQFMGTKTSSGAAQQVEVLIL